MHMHLEAVPAKLLPAEDTKSEKENGKIKGLCLLASSLINYLPLLEDVTLEICTMVFFFVFGFVLFCFFATDSLQVLRITMLKYSAKMTS